MMMLSSQEYFFTGVPGLWAEKLTSQEVQEKIAGVMVRYLARSSRR